MLAVGCGQLGPTEDAWLISLPVAPLNGVLARKLDGIVELIGLPARTDVSKVVETHRAPFLLSLSTFLCVGQNTTHPPITSVWRQRYMQCKAIRQPHDRFVALLSFGMQVWAVGLERSGRFPSICPLQTCTRIHMSYVHTIIPYYDEADTGTTS